MEPQKPEEFENTTGFSMQLLVDLQKVVACLMMRAYQQDNTNLSNQDRVLCKEVAASNVQSSRITLLLRQTPWKQLGCSGQV